MKWLKDLHNVTKQEKAKKADKTKESLNRIVSKMLNWTSPGPDLVSTGVLVKEF